MIGGKRECGKELLRKNEEERAGRRERARMSKREREKRISKRVCKRDRRDQAGGRE